MAGIIAVTQSLLEHALGRYPFRHVTGNDGAAFLTLSAAHDATQTVGGLSLHEGASYQPIDRAVHIWLEDRTTGFALSSLWIFADSSSALPHYHAQLMEHPGERFSFRVDLLPRVDGVNHPSYWQEVYAPLSATRLRLARRLGGKGWSPRLPPTLVQYMSAWHLTGACMGTKELSRFQEPCIRYLDHCIELASSIRFTDLGTEALLARDRKIMAAWCDHDIDPGTWNEVIRLVGPFGAQALELVLTHPVSVLETRRQR